MRKGIRLLLPLGVAAAGGFGCTGGGDASNCSDFPAQPFLTEASDGGGLQIALRSCPAQPPVQGVDTIQYTITDSGGAPQDGLTVSVVPWMASMGHGANAPVVTAAGNGNYVAADVYLYMAGSWQLRTAITGPEINDSVVPVIPIQ